MATALVPAVSARRRAEVTRTEAGRDAPERERAREVGRIEISHGFWLTAMEPAAGAFVRCDRRYPAANH
jgi:hypothetical protein